MEISNEGPGQYFLMKLIVRKIKKSKENVSSIKTMTVKERHSQLIPIVIYSNTLPGTHAGSCYTVTDEILVRSERGMETSTCFIRFVNNENEIKIIRAVHNYLW